MSLTRRGYFGIGIENGKAETNVGTLWRSAYTFDAAFLFTIGHRYQKQASDTVKAWRHVPLMAYDTAEEFFRHLPYGCQLVGVELADSARALEAFIHPERAVYVLGAEDHGLTAVTLSRCHHVVQLPGRFCLNVSVAGSIVMYHRHVQTMRGELL